MMRNYFTISQAGKYPFDFIMWSEFTKWQQFSKFNQFLSVCLRTHPPPRYVLCSASLPPGLALQMHHQGFFEFTLLAKFGWWQIRVRRRKDGLFLLYPLKALALWFWSYSPSKIIVPFRNFCGSNFHQTPTVSSPAFSDPDLLFFFFPIQKCIFISKREREKASPREIRSLVYKVKNLKASYILP